MAEIHRAFPERFAQQERSGREGRYLKLSTQDDGSIWLQGWLESEGGSIVRSALEALAPRKGAEDQRLRNRRLGDALVELASDGVTTEMVVTVPMDTLLGVKGSPPAQTEWGTLLSSEAVRRLRCDSFLRRLVLDADGTIIDFGRRRRLFSPIAKTAMTARDQHCRFPRCEKAARWCEAHHLRPFAADGDTDLKGGVLLCRHHHHLIHEGGWQLIREGDDYRAIPPPDRDWMLPPSAAA